jgi:hypothetical protein
MDDSHWMERPIRNKSGVTVIVIVGVNEANNQLILKKTAIRIVSVTSDYLNQIHATQKLFVVREPTTNTKISDCDIKKNPWCTLGPSCGPRAVVLLHPLTSIHPSKIVELIKFNSKWWTLSRWRQNCLKIQSVS